MKYGEPVSDKEILTHVKTLIKDPIIRKSLLASIEQISFAFRELIDNLTNKQSPLTVNITRLPVKKPGCKQKSAMESLLFFRFHLQKKQREWVPVFETHRSFPVMQTYPVIHDIVSPVLIETITKGIRKQGKISGKNMVASTRQGFYYIFFTAEQLTKKKISVRIELADIPGANTPKNTWAETREKNNIMFLNTCKLNSPENETGIYCMIDDMIENHDLGEVLMEYYQIKLKPLFHDKYAAKR